MRLKRWRVVTCILGIEAVSLVLCFASVAPASSDRGVSDGGKPPTADEIAYFESKIRPVLVKSCYDCHSTGAKDVKGELLLDSREAAVRGGASGAAIVPGKPDESLLIQAIRYTDPDTKMPPKNHGGKLADSVIHDFEAWVKMGAPDPRDGAAPAAPKKYDTTEARHWWAYQPVNRPDVPPDASGWSRSEIDRFVIAGLRAHGLDPVADADRPTLIRRVYFDLIGLPPTPAEIDGFVRDGSPTALAKVVDDLLARRQFGERWGRHWLDVARYAESSGKDFNLAFPHAWRFRDYVINSFNQDKPYDRFIREQIAGDLMPAADQGRRAEQQIATGFLAVGPKSLNEKVNRQFALDVADEQIDTTSQAFLALTMSCARCHDHKFDPISQRDYYAAAGIFLSTRTDYGTLAGLRNDHPSALIELPRSLGLPHLAKTQTRDERERLERELTTVTAEYDEAISERAEALASRSASANQTGKLDVKSESPAQKLVRIQSLLARKAQIESQLAAFDDAGHQRSYCMGVQDRPTGSSASTRVKPGAETKGPGRRQPSGFEIIGDSPLFFRGDANEPRDRVPRGVPNFLAWSGVAPISESESGRREVADWIASPKNPLTARVMANRLWHWLFGQGIVVSVDNFGTMGERPSNQALLDYLACRLVENEWSVKRTIREIVLSRTYQLGSAFDERSFAADPQDALLWRHSQRRLDAECIRDAVLSASGQLTLEPLVGSAIATAGDGPILGKKPSARGNEESLVEPNNNNRSVYLPLARDLLPDAMAVFDAPDSSLVSGARETTNVPAQALFLLNNEFVRTQAKHFAERVIAACPPQSSTNNGALARLPDRVSLAFRLALGRPASPAEIDAASKFFHRLAGQSRPSPTDAWTDFCQALYNTAEFRYLN